MSAGAKVTLRTAGPGDADAVMTVMRAAFDPRYGEAWTPAQLMTLFAVPGTRLGLALRDGEVVGFHAARLAGPETELLLLGVVPELRRQRIGQLLLDDWLAWARANGASDYFLEMRADNDARTLYARAGFEQCGLRRDYYLGEDGQKRDAITMRLLSQ
jgi:[ribosomal protein S18]-alanine N-acetyltransferase